MRRIEVRGERGGYTVVVGSGLLERLPEIVEGEKVPTPRAVVSNTTVGPLYARRVAEILAAAAPFELPDGEVHKRWSSVETTCSAWLADGLHRHDLACAVGGGVITDLAGFAAAVYLRGVDWVALPTTLLAMVDAAVGGKTGINLDQGKNLVGAFWPPRLVVADVDTLVTLADRQLRAGMAEVVKAAWLGDHALLEAVGEWRRSSDRYPASAWVELVARAVAVKVRVVEQDEREAGRRRVLNLGHTLGHALEAAAGYEHLLHGEAVAWGLRAAARLARRRGLLGARSEERLLTAVGWLEPLPPVTTISSQRVLDHLASDKKRDDLGVGWVLPTDDGVVLDQRVSTVEVIEVLGELASWPEST